MSRTFKYLKYKLFSKHKKGHGIHSPFVYSLIKEVFLDSEDYYAYEQVEKNRKLLSSSHEKIKVIDLGAGSKKMGDVRKVSDIVKYSVKSSKYGKLIFRLVNNFNPRSIIEIGTSLGITTKYIALANSNSNVYTIEGCPETAKRACRNFNGINNIKQYIGSFEDNLPMIIDQLDSIDMVFFDGNHQQKSTLEYFEICKHRSTQNTIFIFDDIHWSEGMEQAWSIIKKDKDVSITIDLFELGLVFFRSGVAKQDFEIRF